MAILDDGYGNLWIGKENGSMDILDLKVLKRVMQFLGILKTTLLMKPAFQIILSIHSLKITMVLSGLGRIVAVSIITINDCLNLTISSMSRMKKALSITTQLTFSWKMAMTFG